MTDSAASLRAALKLDNQTTYSACRFRWNLQSCRTRSQTGAGTVGCCFGRPGAWRDTLARLSGARLQSISTVRPVLRVSLFLLEKKSEGWRLPGGRSLQSELVVDSSYCLCRKKAHVTMGLVGHTGGDEVRHTAGNSGYAWTLLDRLQASHRMISRYPIVQHGLTSYARIYLSNVGRNGGRRWRD